MAASGHANGVRVPFINLEFDPNERDASALALIHNIRPEWAEPGSRVEFREFTDGITNTLLKATNEKDGLSQEDIDKEAILIRAYGNGTDILIDRRRERHNHETLMRHSLAPELLARFKNGMMYRFIQGRPTTPQDFRNHEISMAIARRLAEWHATVPCTFEKQSQDPDLLRAVNLAAPRKLVPNIWTIMQGWILQLPQGNEAEVKQRGELQIELERMIVILSDCPGLAENGLVFAHCDLLSGNVILEPKADSAESSKESVSFIDYEYAVPAHPAFDLANHFAEWAGFNCNYDDLPREEERKAFIEEYMRTYCRLADVPSGELFVQAQISKLFNAVDTFRGVPGLYWGIWALIQATISKIEFDYASYAQKRLAEYYTWLGEFTRQRHSNGELQPLREKIWGEWNRKDN